MRDPDPPPRLQTNFASLAQPQQQQQMTVSPKRKRGPSDPTQPFAPRLNTSAFPGPVDVRSANAEPHSAPGALLAAAAAAAVAESGSESPRSRVAHQFEFLQINKGGGCGLPVIDFGSNDAGAVATKKAKHNEGLSELQHYTPHNGDSHISQTGELSPPPQPVQEVTETPQHIAFAGDSVLPTPPPPSSSPSVKLFLSTRRSNPKLHHRSPSPSVGALSASSSSATSTSQPDQAALTWQNSEITGHEVDHEQDDDGYGINGLGFRPTHQVAQHRALKRRQQILEWRARQAREDRQRRGERRRLGALAPERKVGETSKRVVRFA